MSACDYLVVLRDPLQHHSQPPLRLRMEVKFRFLKRKNSLRFDSLLSLQVFNIHPQDSQHQLALQAVAFRGSFRADPIVDIQATAFREEVTDFWGFELDFHTGSRKPLGKHAGQALLEFLYLRQSIIAPGAASQQPSNPRQLATGPA